MDTIADSPAASNHPIVEAGGTATSSNPAGWDWTDVAPEEAADYAWLFMDAYPDLPAMAVIYRDERAHLLDCPWPRKRARALEHLKSMYGDFYIGAGGPGIPGSIRNEGWETRALAPAPASLPPRNAAPPSDRWEALLANEPRARGAAERTLGKPSPSEHDMVLANQCAQAGFSAQEIADALASNRRRRGEDMKHLTYYQKTAAKALTRRYPNA